MFAVTPWKNRKSAKSSQTPRIPVFSMYVCEPITKLLYIGYYGTKLLKTLIVQKSYSYSRPQAVDHLIQSVLQLFKHGYICMKHFPCNPATACLQLHIHICTIQNLELYCTSCRTHWEQGAWQRDIFKISILIKKNQLTRLECHSLHCNFTAFKQY